MKSGSENMVKIFRVRTMGLIGFDGASNNLRATSEVTDLISTKTVNANDSNYDVRLAA